MNSGYVESAGGFKLYVSQYDWFLELRKWYDTLDSDFWDLYKEGKRISKKYHELLDKEELNDEEKYILNRIKTVHSKKKCYEVYKETHPKISKYAKLRSEYFKLCLNNPAQSTAAFQTKSALIALFKIIVENGDMWKARISNSPYDEILMEVVEEKAKYYRDIMENCMIKEGNKWLKSNLFEMQAEAVIGNSWYECH